LLPVILQPCARPGIWCYCNKTLVSPGGATSINIRGIGSIYSTAPLVIIDGVAASLDNINNDDIESIQILKDAGASAIYGVRAANGVIVVTHQKG